MADRGRKGKVTEKKYLDAVKRKRTDKDIVIAGYLSVHRSNIGRFKKNNPDVVKKGQDILNGFISITYDAKNLTFEAYMQIPIIQKWIGIMEDRMLAKETKDGRLRVIYNVSRHLNVHPENLSLDQVADLVNDSKKAYYADEKYIRGLSFLYIRKPVRSWFELIHGVSGELLSSIGIHAESSKGSGSSANERVTKEQREVFMKVLYDCVYTVVNENTKFSHYRGKEDMLYMEIKGMAYFMYYTGTRIGSSNPDTQGSFSVRLNNNKHSLTSSKWSINLVDKGEKGGIEWNKLLMLDGKDKLKEYVSKRFNIPFENVEIEMKRINSYMFPLIRTNYDLERIIMRSALEKSGVTTKSPNHIWRHTFAQDFLHASDWNYELCASIGGWRDTGTLKKHYGQMSDDAKERGLQRAMGLEPEDVTYELRF